MLTLIVSLRRPGKGRPTGPEHVCYAAERVNVRSTRRAFKLPLFRRSVGIAETLLERVRGGRIGDETSNSEIGDLLPRSFGDLAFDFTSTKLDVGNRTRQKCAAFFKFLVSQWLSAFGHAN